MKSRLKISERAIDDLIRYARNARTHDKDQVAQIAASIQEFGWTNPVLIDEGGNIIAGHGRVLAAEELGIQSVPCIVLEGLTEAQKRAYRIADNKLPLNAGWDEDLLSLEFADLKEMDFNLELTGFRFSEIEALLPEADEAEWPDLPTGERSPFQQMTFTLHDDQVEIVRSALAAAKEKGPFEGPNENSNGNALARICSAYVS